jgi:hypothetical protein
MPLNAIGNVFSSILNWKSQKDTNQTNVNLWREQSQYNHPKNMRARLTEAGMNPNLAYGNPTSSGLAASAPRLDAPKTANPLENVNPLIFLQAEQIKSATEANKATASLTREKTFTEAWKSIREQLKSQGDEIAVRWLDQQYAAKVGLDISRKALADAQTANAKEQTKLIQLDQQIRQIDVQYKTALTKAQLSQTRAQTALIETNKKMADVALSFTGAEKESSIRLKIKQAEVMTKQLLIQDATILQKSVETRKTAIENWLRERGISPNDQFYFRYLAQFAAQVDNKMGFEPFLDVDYLKTYNK